MTEKVSLTAEQLADRARSPCGTGEEHERERCSAPRHRGRTVAAASDTG
jgi:hypothetical protein